MTVTADDLEAALAGVAGALGAATDRDWSAAAGTGEWDAWHTAEHLGDGLLSYAGQLVGRLDDRYARFLASAEADASPAEVLEFAVIGGRLLAAAVRTAAADVRAYHPAGRAEPAGFAAMGCVEALVHGADIARGLGVEPDPPRGVCARVLARLFPHSADDLARPDSGVDAWDALRWATDRLQLPGRERQAGWSWRGAPLDE